jgi:predicted transcriptional regulator
MAELNFDRPVPALTDEEDLETLAAIDEATAQIEAGEGIPLEELRKEFERRCSK